MLFQADPPDGTTPSPLQRTRRPQHKIVASSSRPAANGPVTASDRPARQQRSAGHDASEYNQTHPAGDSRPRPPRPRAGEDDFAGAHFGQKLRHDVITDTTSAVSAATRPEAIAPTGRCHRAGATVFSFGSSFTASWCGIERQRPSPLLTAPRLCGPRPNRRPQMPLIVESSGSSSTVAPAASPRWHVPWR